MTAGDDGARAQRTWLERQQEVRDAEANFARAERRLASAREALEESEDALFPEKDDQDD